MKKLAKISLALLTALALTGCSNNAKPKRVNKPNNHSFKVTKNNKSGQTTSVGHLSSNNLSPQKTVSVVVAYAGKKYPTKWGAALVNAQKNGLRVNLKKQADYAYMKQGSGVAYMITNDLGYTLKQVGNDNQIYLFANKEQIGSALISQMVDYLNHHDGEKTVNALAQNAEVNDERDDSGSAESANGNSSKKTNLPGDAGLFQMPTNMQGIWYGYSQDADEMTVLRISSSEIAYKDGNDSGGSILHKMKPDFLDHTDPTKLPKSYQKATQNWGRTAVVNKKVRNINWINVSGWLQTAGDGEFYGLYNEEGQQVLVSAHGAGLWADTVYWKTPALAKQYKGKEFKGLGWQ